MAAQPIWKDYFVSLGTASSIYYRISVGGTIVHEGRAYKRPGEYYNQIRINDICADILERRMLGEFYSVSLPLTFVISTSTNGTSWSTLTSVQFHNDWSYDRDYSLSDGMAFPITGRFVQGQWMTFTGVSSSSVVARVRYKSGSSGTITIPITINSAFPQSLNEAFTNSVKACGGGTAVFNLASYASIDTITIGNATYKASDKCVKYCLYYRNEYGGFDFLDIEGNVVEHDSVNRNEVRLENDNRNITKGVLDQLNTIEKGWTLHSGFIGDGGERMHHLLSSTDVYLCDLERNEMIPVVITNGDAEHLNYRNNGCKMVDFTIECKVAENRIRR